MLAVHIYTHSLTYTHIHTHTHTHAHTQTSTLHPNKKKSYLLHKIKQTFTPTMALVSMLSRVK